MKYLVKHIFCTREARIYALRTEMPGQRLPDKGAEHYPKPREIYLEWCHPHKNISLYSLYLALENRQEVQSVHEA